MRKLLAVFLFLTLSTFILQAQSDSKNTIGIHGVLGYGFLNEISYQRELFTKNRLETDFGFYVGGGLYEYQFTGIYQWVWKDKSGFGFFAGAGGGVIYYDDHFGNGIVGKICGNVGIEYNFKFPLQIALDIRPENYFIDALTDNFKTKLGLASRYRF